LWLDPSRPHDFFPQQMDDFEDKARQAMANPRNVGEMEDADAVGTAGSADCGDMLRMWLKFTEKDGRKVIDRASFQSFGCQTAIAVASMATELLKGKSVEDARNLSPDDLTGDLGPLPPMKIHCGELVEGALQNALGKTAGNAVTDPAPTLAQSLSAKTTGTIRIVPLDEDEK
jgi:nitrogen fixation NifU-like protein